MHIIQENSFFSGEIYETGKKNYTNTSFDKFHLWIMLMTMASHRAQRRKRHFLFRSMAAAIGFKQKLPSPISHGIHFQDTNKYYIRRRLMKNSNM